MSSHPSSVHGVAKSLWIVLLSSLFIPTLVPDAQALPAFARKYEVNCHVCHTRWPRLNVFGERFLENGYQLPGTEDGGLIGKVKLGDLTLDDVSNYLAFLFSTEGVRHVTLKEDIPGSGDQTELGTITILRMFAAGTLSENVSFLVDLTSFPTAPSTSGQSTIPTDDLELGRAYVGLNNLGGPDWAHLRVGRIDPSAFFSVATDRPAFAPIAPVGGTDPTTGAPALTRWPFFPSSEASKFYGLFKRSETPIFPFEPTLYNSFQEVGIDVHGRPFGDWFLYQLGILNGGNERTGDSNDSKDWYIMARFDYAQSHDFSANISGFAYFGNNNAKVLVPNPFGAPSFSDVNRSRYGVGARLRYKWLDVYGVFTIDRVTGVPDRLDPIFDGTATGLTLEAHAIATDRLLLGMRFDHLDAGGLEMDPGLGLDTRTSATFVGAQAKYYFRSNIFAVIRYDVNVRKAEGGTSPARNLRNNFVAELSMVF